MRRSGVPALAAALVLASCTTPVARVEPPPPDASPLPPATVTEAPSGAFGGPGIGDRLYPELGNGGYDVERYSFEITVDADWRVEAIARIELTPLESLSGFNLDLAGLDVEYVHVVGFPTVTYEHEDRELAVDLGGTAVAGLPISATVAYSGTPTSVPADAVPFRPGWQQADDMAYLFSQPDGAQSLFPVNDHPLDRADVHLTVTTPTGVEAVSGGVVVSESREGSADTVVWEMADIAPYQIPLAIGQFTLVSDREVDGIRYDVWVSDDLIEWTAVDTFEIQPEVISFFEERFGPYPFERAGALIVDDDLGAALETQTIPTYSAISAGWGEVVIAHELAHQWFGDSITVEQWDDIWLNEGFATFAHWLWIEQRFGLDRYDSEVAGAYRTLSGIELAESGVTPAIAADRVRAAFPPPDDPRASDLFNRSVYERGGLALVALRDSVGDTALFDLIRTYTQRYAGSSITTEAFLALVDEVLGAEPAALLAGWVGDVEIPPLPDRGLVPPG